MAGQTFSARQVARIVTAKVGRDVDAKRIRAWVRDNVAAFDDDDYTAHVYDARTRDRIVAAFVAKAKGSTGTDARSKAATTGRKGKAAAPRADRKRTARPPVPPMSGDVDGETPKA